MAPPGSRVAVNWTLSPLKPVHPSTSWFIAAWARRAFSTPLTAHPLTRTTAVTVRTGDGPGGTGGAARALAAGGAAEAHATTVAARLEKTISQRMADLTFAHAYARMSNFRGVPAHALRVIWIDGTKSARGPIQRRSYEGGRGGDGAPVYG